MSIENAREWLLSQNKNRGAFKLKRATKIAISSGKGGVGKTTVALQLAKTLSEKKRVLLIDCDFNLSNTAIKLKLPLNNNFYDLITQKKDFQDCLIKFSGFDLLSGCNGSIDLFNGKFEFEKIIIDIVRTHENSYDYVIFDGPAGMGRETLVLNAYCDHCIVVVTPDRASITDSYSMIKVLNKEFMIGEVYILANKVELSSQYKKIVKGLSETVENFLGARVKVLGGVPNFKLPTDKLDDLLFYGEKNTYSKIFNKIFSVFSDGSSDSIHYAAVGGMEQDVQLSRI